MMRPASVQELQDVVRGTASVRVRAGGTKSVPDPRSIDLGLLSGLDDYSPEECVFTARAGTPIDDVASVLMSRGQYMPFDPPFADSGATLGGTVAAGVSGPGRYRYGGVRDFLLGVQVVDGEGRLIRSGGKVVKNAAGFLLHHGMVGSGGRFGVITEVTFKVFPAPEARRSIQVACGGVADALAAARHLQSRRVDCESIEFDERGTLQVTVSGRVAAIERRLARIADVLETRGDPADADASFRKRESLLDGQSLVKVPGVVEGWQALRAHVTGAHFMCAGAVAWVITDDLDALASALKGAKLAGRVIRGTGAGRRVGHIVHNEFEERVRHVLDPSDRFSAAPNPDR